MKSPSKPSEATVFVVSEGAWGDWTPIAVFTSREEAEACEAKMPRNRLIAEVPFGKYHEKA